MRIYAVICVIVAFAMVIAPTAAVGKEERGREAVTQAVSERQADDDTIAVLATASGKVEEIEMREYLIGVTAAEVSPLSHEEAIKAQAVAAYTYALYTKNKNRKSASDSLKGADITDSSATHQAYHGKKKRRERFGENFDEYEKKISDAVDEVLGVYMVYDGEPVLAVYHGISNGKTQSAKGLWGSEIPYLQSVSSAGDELSPDYSDTVIYTVEQFEECMGELGAEPEGDAENWLGKLEENSDGYVKTLEICGEKYTGDKVRRTFGLKSASFTVEYTESGFKFRTLGYGHGVGMSQYAADYMARQGSSWQEILKHYYTGIEFAKM